MTRARRSGASTASRRPARHRSTPSAESRVVARRHDSALRHRRRARRRQRELTAELVTALGRAAVRVLGREQPFVVGRDTRRPARCSRPRWSRASAPRAPTPCSSACSPRPAVATSPASERRAGRDDLGQPQPVRRQRRQAVRGRRAQAPRTDSRRAVEARARATSRRAIPAAARSGSEVGVASEYRGARSTTYVGLPGRRARGPPARRHARGRRLRQRRRVPRRARRAAGARCHGRGAATPRPNGTNINDAVRFHAPRGAAAGRARPPRRRRARVRRRRRPRGRGRRAGRHRRRRPDARDRRARPARPRARCAATRSSRP